MTEFADMLSPGGQFVKDLDTLFGLNEDVLFMARRYLTNGAASCWWRLFYQIADAYPFKTFALADVDLGDEERDRLAQEVASSKLCCQDSGFTRPLLESFGEDVIRRKAGLLADASSVRGSCVWALTSACVLHL